MAVKHVQSAARVLTTFEALAEHQPVGVGALARLLGDDKSAVQRALVTLADAGWIERVGDGTQWEVTSRVAQLTQPRAGLRERARATLETLRDETGETVLLSVLEGGKVVVLDVVESPQLVRTAPDIGLVIPAPNSAAGQAILAHLPEPALADVIGGEPDAPLRRRLAAVRRQGWAVNARGVTPGASAVGAGILDADGHAVASLAISAPADRMPPDVQNRWGALVASAARRLSTH